MCIHIYCLRQILSSATNVQDFDRVWILSTKHDTVSSHLLPVHMHAGLTPRTKYYQGMENNIRFAHDPFIVAWGLELCLSQCRYAYRYVIIPSHQEIHTQEHSSSKLQILKDKAGWFLNFSHCQQIPWKDWNQHYCPCVPWQILFLCATELQCPKTIKN